MKKHLASTLPLLLCVLLAFLALGQTAPSTTRPAAAISARDPDHADIATVRNGLVDAMNTGNLDKLLTFVHPEVVCTWANAEVSIGPEGIRSYYNKMMSGPDRRVQSIHLDPKVEGYKFYGDNVLISYGSLNDQYTLTDGSEFNLNSRFSSLLVKENGKWLIKGFHASGNIFDNPVQSLVVKKVTMWTAIIAGIAGIILGSLLTAILRKKRA